MEKMEYQKLIDVEDAVLRYRQRRKVRLDAKTQYDAEQTGEEESSGAHGNTRLPYGLAQREGIDTQGMTPKEVWEALEGKGISATEEYKKLKERNSVAKKSDPDEEFFEAAKGAKNAYEFWFNLTDEQREKIGSGSKYKEIYERVKSKAGEASEWKPKYKTSVDMPTRVNKPNEGIKISFFSNDRDGLVAHATDEGKIEININGMGFKDGGIDDDTLMHEFGHQISNFGLAKDIAMNYGDMFGRYNSEKQHFFGIYNEYNPEEAFAESFSRYICQPDKQKEEYPEVYEYFQRLGKENPWIQEMCDETRIAYVQAMHENGHKLGEKELETFYAHSSEETRKKLESISSKKTSVSKFKRPEAQNKTVNSIIKKTANLKNEQYRIIAPDGTVLLENRGGDRGSVATTVGEKREAFGKGKGAISIHNHPDGGTFSAPDLRDFGFGATEIFATAPEGTYVLRDERRISNPKDIGDWVEMQEKLQADIPEMSHKQIWDRAEQYPEVIEIRKKEKALTDSMMAEYDRMKSEGRPQGELQSYLRESDDAKKYAEISEERKKTVEQARRKAEVEPFDTFFKENAEQFGFSYEFIPHKKAKGDSVDSTRTDSVDSYQRRRDIRKGVSSVYRYQRRRDARMDARMDADKESNGKNHGNTHLPYGIAKSEGIDTEGMSPKEVWEILEGKGYSAKEEYSKLSNKKKEPETITRAIHTGGGVSKFQKFKNPYVTEEEREVTKRNIQTHIDTGRSYKGWMHPKAFDTAGMYIRDEIADRFKRRKKNKDLDEYIDKPQIEDVYDVLKDVRPFGAPTTFKNKHSVYSELSDERTKQIMDDAFSRFPSQWFEDSETELKVHILNSEGRANYINKYYSPDGKGHIYIYAKQDESLRKDLGYDKIPEDRNDADIANILAHEMGHYMEDANESLHSMCRSVLESRTAKSEEEYLEAGYTTKKDSFFDPYMGKQYAWGDTEILSVLMQHMGYCDPMDDMRGMGIGHFSSKPTDKDSMKFIFGLLAGF